MSKTIYSGASVCHNKMDTNYIWNETMSALLTLSPDWKKFYYCAVPVTLDNFRAKDHVFVNGITFPRYILYTPEIRDRLQFSEWEPSRWTPADWDPSITGDMCSELWNSHPSYCEGSLTWGSDAADIDFYYPGKRQVSPSKVPLSYRYCILPNAKGRTYRTNGGLIYIAAEESAKYGMVFYAYKFSPECKHVNEISSIGTSMNDVLGSKDGVCNLNLVVDTSNHQVFIDGFRLDDAYGVKYVLQQRYTDGNFGWAFIDEHDVLFIGTRWNTDPVTVRLDMPLTPEEFFSLDMSSYAFKQDFNYVQDTPEIPE